MGRPKLYADFMRKHCIRRRISGGGSQRGSVGWWMVDGGVGQIKLGGQLVHRHGCVMRV